MVCTHAATHNNRLAKHARQQAEPVGDRRGEVLNEVLAMQGGLHCELRSRKSTHEFLP
jgi:hypothetical protein